MDSHCTWDHRREYYIWWLDTYKAAAARTFTAAFSAEATSRTSQIFALLVR